MFRQLLLAVSLGVHASSIMAIDLNPLWNFDDPDQSEQRFRAALATATGDDAIILQTQIARSYGLRGDFSKAREILKDVERQLPTAGAEARARYSLELGRTYASAAHPPETQTAGTKEQAREAYEQAYEVARRAELDGLAVDALHMLAFVDTEPADQLKWAQKALAIAQASSQPAAKKWEASLRNNIGYALYQLGRYDEALDQFKQAVMLREKGEDVQAKRVAHWMVAWTLRALNRPDEALEIQLRLERERQADGAPSPYVFEELELLYRGKGDRERADHYAELKKATAK
ncbi:MAG TPA: tetratricopeptide repeat protein [Casimicrobiaceae bacterium]|nr:tetratricopeptide repeat protein [Casimicrobiaceae bacterium]